jgi:hypothetical protein
MARKRHAADETAAKLGQARSAGLFLQTFPRHHRVARRFNADLLRVVQHRSSIRDISVQAGNGKASHLLCQLRFSKDHVCCTASHACCRLSGRLVPAGPPPWHFADDIITLEFRTETKAAEATLPSGLSPNPQSNGRVVALFAGWQITGQSDASWNLRAIRHKTELCTSVSANLLWVGSMRSR